MRKPHLRTNYKEANIEEDLDLRNQYKIRNLPDPVSIREATSEIYDDENFNDPNIIKCYN